MVKNGVLHLKLIDQPAAREPHQPLRGRNSWDSQFLASHLHKDANVFSFTSE